MSPALKYAPAVLLPFAGALPFDWLWIPFIAVALIAAWMARIGQRLAEREAWPEIRRDLIVSMLLGMANAIIAAAAIARFGLNYLEGMAVAFFLALGGVETMKIGWGSAKRLWAWLIDRWFESEGARRQEAAKAEALRVAELKRMAGEIDADNARLKRERRDDRL